MANGEKKPGKPLRRQSLVTNYTNASKVHSDAIDSMKYVERAVLKSTQVEIDALKVVRALVHVDLGRLREKVDEKLNAIVEYVAREFDLDPKVIYVTGAWGCEANGPAKLCFYDDAEDPCHDECLYCGQPTERK